MKILLANKFFYIKGGAEESFFSTANLLSVKGHEAVFFSMKHPLNLPSKYEKYFVDAIDYEKSELTVGKKIKDAFGILYSFEAKKKIRALAASEKPDVAHLNNIYHQLSPSIIDGLKSLNIPVIMTLRDFKLVCPAYSISKDNKACDQCKEGRYYNCLINRCVHNSMLKSVISCIEMYFHHKLLHIYNKVDVFISPSMFLKNKVESMGFKGKIVFLPNFVNIGEYKPQFNWDEQSIVYFGRVAEEKGLRTLIKAMSKIPSLNLKIIGEGPARLLLEAFVNGLSLKNVSFLGYMTGEKLKNEIRRSMFVVLPSECSENNPRGIIEGFALGKPAVASRIGGIPELVKDEETGFLFEPANVDELTARIRFLFENTDKIRTMGMIARNRVENELSEGAHYKKLMQIYNEAIEKGRAR